MSIKLMRFSLGITLFLILMALVGLSLPQPARVQAATSNQKVISATINIEIDPVTLDPSLATDTASRPIIEQLFIGLIDLNDTTGAVEPELASHWDISADRKVFTFSLRTDAKWTDGAAITAEDVRYGVLRTLDPANNSGPAPQLYPIKNAEAYHSGALTDANQVGVTTVNSATIRFTLDDPMPTLAFFNLPGLQPVPQTTIQTWGDQWTDPGHIVSSGPYRLTEWNHDNYIILDKNLTFYDAANVQIEQIKAVMVSWDAAGAGQLYLNDQLDTTLIWEGMPDEILQSHAIKTYRRLCTYTYNFDISKAPFDNLKVRRAFVAAINRQGLIYSKLGGYPDPALTFSPPGVFGYVDGYTEGVGIPYNTAQAQQWLAEAGYPGGQGLPPITMSMNEGHEEIGQYIQQNWFNTLGVSVTIQTFPWDEYLRKIDNGDFQVWRIGWCADYPDAYNFLRDGIDSNQEGYGGWSNATYDNLLNQALYEQNSSTREALFKQAEKILVETDAVVVPIYYLKDRVVSQPYLDRTYPVFDTADIADWRITSVYETIDQTGGVVASTDNQTTVQFPTNSFTDTVEVTFSPAYATRLEPDQVETGQTFEITAVYSDTDTPVSTTPVSFTLVLTYDNLLSGQAVSLSAIINENNLGLYYWEGDRWVQEPSATINADTNTITVTTNKLGRWAILETMKLTYLPAILK